MIVIIIVRRFSSIGNFVAVHVSRTSVFFNRWMDGRIENALDGII